MIRGVLLLWVAPLGFFWGWYALSYYDVSFGTFFLSRALHDHVFGIYGELLGIDPATIGPMLMRACALDSLLVLAVVAFRKRKAIAAWWRGQSSVPASRIEAILSKAP